jgi:hypothetical protein
MDEMESLSHTKWECKYRAIAEEKSGGEPCSKWINF